MRVVPGANEPRRPGLRTASSGGEEPRRPELTLPVSDDSEILQSAPDLEIAVFAICLIDTLLRPRTGRGTILASYDDVECRA